MPRTDAIVTIVFEYAGTTGNVTHHFAGESDGLIGPDPGLHDLCQSWRDHLELQFRDVLTPEYTLVKIGARELLIDPHAPAHVAEISIGLAGTRPHGSDDLTPALVCCTTTRTALTGKRRRGRFYCSGGAEEDVSAKTLIDSSGSWFHFVKNYAQHALDQYGASGADDTWTWTVFSRPDANAGGSIASGQHPITAFQTHQDVRYLRSRAR